MQSLEKDHKWAQIFTCLDWHLTSPRMQLGASDWRNMAILPIIFCWYNQDPIIPQEIIWLLLFYSFCMSLGENYTWWACFDMHKYLNRFISTSSNHWYYHTKHIYHCQEKFWDWGFHFFPADWISESCIFSCWWFAYMNMYVNICVSLHVHSE